MIDTISFIKVIKIRRVYPFISTTDFNLELMAQRSKHLKFVNSNIPIISPCPCGLQFIKKINSLMLNQINNSILQKLLNHTDNLFVIVKNKRVMHFYYFKYLQ